MLVNRLQQTLLHFEIIVLAGDMAVEKGIPCYREESKCMNKWLLKVFFIC